MSRLIKTAVLTFAALTFLMINSSAQSAENEFSAKQKQEINQMIRDYILEHPEILPEAIQILQDRAKTAAIDKHYAGLYEDGFSHVGGNLNGDITIIEFFDYNCAYCKHALDTIEKLKQDDKNLRVIYKEFPILSESSYTAAKAAMAAIEQGKYESFHTALLRNTGKLTEDRIFEIARDIGLDEQKLIKDMTSPIMDRNIKINRGLADTLGINGTPGFVIGTEIIPGALPYEELVRLIEKARKQAAKNTN